MPAIVRGRTLEELSKRDLLELIDQLEEELGQAEFRSDAYEKREMELETVESELNKRTSGQGRQADKP